MDSLYEFKINNINFSDFDNSFIVDGDKLLLLRGNIIERFLIQLGFDSDNEYILLLLSRENIAFDDLGKIFHLHKNKQFLALSESEGILLLDYSFKLQKRLINIKKPTHFFVEHISEDLSYIGTVDTNGTLVIYTLIKDVLKQLHLHNELKITQIALSYPNVCYASGMEYRMLNLIKSLKTPLFVLDESSRPIIYPFTNGEFLLLGPGSLGLFCNENGPLPCGSLTLPSSIERIEFFWNYIVIETDEFFIIYNKKDQKQLITIPNSNNHMFAIDILGRRVILFACQSESSVRMFGETPWYKKCQKLIFNGSLSEADKVKSNEEKKINQLALSYPDMIELIQQHFHNISCKLKNLQGFMYLAQVDTKMSLDKFIEGHLDPRELLVRHEKLELHMIFVNDPFYVEDDLLTFQKMARNASEMCEPEKRDNLYSKHMHAFQDMLLMYLNIWEEKSPLVKKEIRRAILKLSLCQIPLPDDLLLTKESGRELLHLVEIEASKDVDVVIEILSETDCMKYPLAMIHYMFRDQNPCYLELSLESLFDLFNNECKENSNIRINYLAALINCNISLSSFPPNEQELFHDVLLDEMAYPYCHALILVKHLERFKISTTKLNPIPESFIRYLPKLEARFLKTLKQSDDNKEVCPGQLLTTKSIIKLLEENSILIYLESKKNFSGKPLNDFEEEIYEQTLCLLAMRNPSEYGSLFLSKLKLLKIKNPKKLIKMLNESELMIFEQSLLHGFMSNHDTALSLLKENFPLVKEYIEVFLSHDRNPLMMDKVAEFLLHTHSIDHLIEITNEFGGRFDVSRYFDHLSQIQIDRVSVGLTKCLAQTNHDLVCAKLKNTLVKLDTDKEEYFRPKGACVFDKNDVRCWNCTELILLTEGFVVDYDREKVFHKNCYEQNY